MSFLDQVVSAAPSYGQKILISGVEGVGKTSLGCGAPSSLLIPLEGGFTNIKTPRLPNVLTTWAQVEGVCLEIIAKAKAGQFPAKSIVWDSATALERIIHTETLNMDTPASRKALGTTHSMETAHGGYGKAYPIANELFAKWLRYQDELAMYGKINIIVTCHVFVVRVADPDAGEYDTFELLMHSPKNAKSYGKREMITQWADGIFFLHEKIFVSKTEGEKVSRGISKGEGRVLEFERSPAWTAKNRYGLTGSTSIPPDGWNNLADAIFKSSGIDLYNRAIVPTKKES